MLSSELLRLYSCEQLRAMHVTASVGLHSAEIITLYRELGSSATCRGLWVHRERGICTVHNRAKVIIILGFIGANSSNMELSMRAIIIWHSYSIYDHE